MVAGKVKAAMGLQKSHANTKPEPLPSSSPSPSSGKAPQKGTSFSRSLSNYFPRASAQVLPKPPDVTALLRVIEQLRERESRLKTELLEYKILKESVAILPFLEEEIARRDNELGQYSEKIDSLESENERLRREMDMLHCKFFEHEAENEENKKIIEQLEGEISELRKAQAEKESEEMMKSQRFQHQGAVDASCKSNVGKKLKKSVSLLEHYNANRNEIEVQKVKKRAAQNSEEITGLVSITTRSPVPRVPKPPPRPSLSVSVSPSANFSASTLSPSSSSSSSSSSFSGAADRVLTKMSVIPVPPPPPPRPLFKVPTKSARPPPPPLPLKVSKNGVQKVRRAPEVVEFYHSLMRRDSRRDCGKGAAATANARDMIGEIENRSTHLLAVDERAVLKHFQWPEQKADTLREAAFGFSDLKKLESEASSFRDDPRQLFAPALKKIQALFEKLEHGVYNLSRMRESAAIRYKGFGIPMDWMLDTGYVTQMKLASVKLAMKYMRRVSAELENPDGGTEEEELIIQGVKFAFRVHQFAGGFDAETMRAFEELRDKAKLCQKPSVKIYM
ncbi:protein INCREASED PETAL GROWTH ANISOTROPY 1-like isoform X2 [Apium graveolens]|uniref:protein INCREASED PETAL GROWTH ANISOTROPY 1-like isoform X2 n=1 Tax=Apium graveolens TaxID=4045 RepID=UPI003D7B6B9F